MHWVENTFSVHHQLWGFANALLELWMEVPVVFSPLWPSRNSLEVRKGWFLLQCFLFSGRIWDSCKDQVIIFFISCFFNFIIKGGLFILILHIINPRGLIDPWIWFQVVQFYPSELLWVFQGVLWLQNMNSVLQAITWLLQPNHIGQEGMTARREKLFDLILFYLTLFTLCNPSALSALWSLLLWGHSWRVSFHKPHFSRDLAFKAFPQVRNCLQYYMCM